MSTPVTLHHARYTVLAPGALVGAGGQGSVVRVRDADAPERALVAKVLHVDAPRGPLLTEFRLLAGLGIPGLVVARDLAWDVESGAPFLVEDYAEGQDVQSYVHDARTVDERNHRLESVVAETLRVLADLHDAGFLHGDLKPAHLRWTTSGICVLDLGAAVLRSLDAHALTPAFAAPEVRAGGRPGVASDLYALGRTVVAIATGTAGETSLRRRAPWAAPAIRDLVVHMLAEHPRDRPGSAELALGALGASRTRRGRPKLLGREEEVARCLGSRLAVLYLVGPAGSGKSHLLREMALRASTQARPVRLLSLANERPEFLLALGAFLRGDPSSWPFSEPPRNGALLLVDDGDQGGPDFAAAVESYRCRNEGADGVRLVVATDSGAGATLPSVELGPLPEPVMRELGAAAGLDCSAAELREAAGSPGWLLARAGLGTLRPAAALERARHLPPEASTLLGALGLAGGVLPRHLARTWGAAQLPELLEQGLVVRRVQDASISLASTGLASPLGEALGSPALADTLAEAMLTAGGVPARALLGLASGPHAPTRRSDLLRAAADAARAEGQRSLEHEALRLLLADPKRRGAAELVRFERLCRDLGGALHPEALGWLGEWAETDASLRVLALRRRAEAQARAGEHEAAQKSAEAAYLAAGNGIGPRGLARSTQGAVALFRADWPAAAAYLGEAKTLLASAEVDDQEELARMEHNRGVVLLYRGGLADAEASFEQSLARKRRLGDRAGVRSCLLNLALTRTKCAKYMEALAALEEAMRLARSLGQTAGLAWCLAAKAEVHVRQRDVDGAERAIAEAVGLGSGVPASVRADLLLLRAEVALLRGAPADALAAVNEVPQTLLEGDAMVAAKVALVRAEAALQRVPVDGIRAARAAIDAVRAARRGELTELADRGVRLLHRARGRDDGAIRRMAPAAPSGPLPSMMVQLPLLELARGGDRPQALLAAAVRQWKAERAFLVALDESGSVAGAHGCDREGLPIVDAARRVGRGVLDTAVGSPDPVYLPEVSFDEDVGSSLAMAAPEPAPGLLRAVLVLEHRFRPRHFDGASPELLAGYAALGQLTLHLGASVSAEPAREAASRGAAPATPTAATTALPQPGRRRHFPHIVGSSPMLERALGKLDLAIDSDLPVLLTGETGVGKELFARALHDQGPRAGAPFVALNCGAVPDALFEAELFGHAKGSFTGAERARPGLLARAEGGTLLFDEIGELPLARQVSLLRVLETRTYRPVGSDDERTFDARIVAATHRDLGREVEKGTFRADLLFRLNVVEVRIPSLRERRSDVPLLVRAFEEKLGRSLSLSAEARAAIAGYDFPGNVRELLHLLERLSILRTRVEWSHLPRELRRHAPAPLALDRSTTVMRASPLSPVADELAPAPLGAVTAEHREVERALAASGGNITHAAESLGLTRHGLKKRMVRLGLRPAKKDPS